MKFLLLVVLALLMPAWAFTVDLEFYGKAQGTVTGYKTFAVPQQFENQIADCNVTTPAVFKSNSYAYRCRVTTSVLKAEKYEGGFLDQTEQTKSLSGAAIVESLKTKSDFLTATKIVKWVETQIEYDPGYGDVTNTCETTLTQKRGTCDELAITSIGLLREAGIASRYIRGITFDGSNWVEHAWLEAAIDGWWVPFDPASHQHGVLDKYHIAQIKSVDASKAIDFTYGKGSWIHSIKAEVIDESTVEPFTATLDLPEKIPRNGFAKITATLTNKLPHPIEVLPNLAVESQNIEDNLKIVWKKFPEVLDRNAVYEWVVVAPDFDEMKTYTLPITLVGENPITKDIVVEGKCYDEFEVYSDKTHYITGEPASYKVKSKNKIIELESQNEYENTEVIKIAASKNTAFISGCAFESPASIVQDSYPVNVIITAPDSVVSNRPFEIIVSVKAPKQEITLRTLGKTYDFTPPAVINLSTTLSKTAEIEFEIDDLHLKKRIKVERGSILGAIWEFFLKLLRKL